MTVSRRTSHDFGKWAEDLAVQHLSRKGYTIIERNARCHLGEVDVIASQNDILVFIEIKAVRTLAKGHPLERIGRVKRHKLERLARRYLSKHASRLSYDGVRFDVIAIVALDELHPHEDELVHVVDAFRV